MYVVLCSFIPPLLPLLIQQMTVVIPYHHTIDLIKSRYMPMWYFFIVAIFNDSIYNFLQDIVRRQTEILQLAIPNLESRCVRQYYHIYNRYYNYITIKQLHIYDIVYNI